jgi:hypothetical protein
VQIATLGHPVYAASEALKDVASADDPVDDGGFGDVGCDDAQEEVEAVERGDEEELILEFEF